LKPDEDRGKIKMQGSHGHLGYLTCLIRTVCQNDPNQTDKTPKNGLGLKSGLTERHNQLAFNFLENHRKR